MKILLSLRAEKEFRKLAKIDQIAVARKIRSLGVPSAISNEEKLVGFSNIYRVRVGNYRVVYKRTVGEIFIVLVGHRKDIYQMVRQILR